VFLGEPLTFAQVFGAGLVLSGIVLIDRRTAPAAARECTR
jgi:drug/metabolite transporter (DMT)-like permease